MGSYGGVELDEVELSGPRLALRRWRPEDADRLWTIMQDRSMYEFLALPDPYTRADANDYAAERGHEGRQPGVGLGCAVVERASGRLVGSAVLRLTDDPEIGYWIAPDARGHGYAAEATRALAEWGFSVGVSRILLACDVRNLASVRTALAAGFAFEGVARNAITSPGGGAVPPRRADLARFARLPDDRPGPLPYAFPPPPAEGLSDGVLRLRLTCADDAPALVETDDAVALGWSFTGVGRSLPEVRRNAAQAGLQWLVGRLATFTMVDVATGRVAGSIAVRNPGPPQIGGIGYGVHPDFRGRGYTARALRLVASWAFDVADLARLELGAKVGNEASIRSAANAGFEPDGIRGRRLRNPDGTFTDEVRYALINPRYR